MNHSEQKYQRVAYTTEILALKDFYPAGSYQKLLQQKFKLNVLQPLNRSENKKN